MAGYKPAAPFVVKFLLLIPTSSVVLGNKVKSFPEPAEGLEFYGSFRTFGGTEREVNGVYTVEETGQIDTWYRPDIKSDCRVVIAETGATYEILGSPENIEMRNQFLRFRVKRTKGGV